MSPVGIRKLARNMEEEVFFLYLFVFISFTCATDKN